MRVLLRRHVLQHDRADEPDERGRNNHAQTPQEPGRGQRAEDEIGRRRAVQPTGGYRVRAPVSAAVNRFPMLDRYKFI